MKIIAIGRNYTAHAKELNNNVPEKPLFFFKPETALLRNNQPFYIPDFSNEVDYECEIVVKINRLGKGIQEKFANRYYEEIGLGIDFTARDLQRECKKKGLPWEIAKAFDHSAAIGKFINKSKFESVQNIDFRLEKNNEIVQESNSGQMIFSVDHIISSISQFITLKIGDLIFTGTPSGTGPVIKGDKLSGWIQNEKMFEFKVF